MKVTFSVSEAGIGSIGGHIEHRRTLIDEVERCVQEQGKNLIIDYCIGHTGDDISLICTHENGLGDETIHKSSWDAFIAGTDMPNKQDFREPVEIPSRMLSTATSRGWGQSCSPSVNWNWEGLTINSSNSKIESIIKAETRQEDLSPSEKYGEYSRGKMAMRILKAILSFKDRK